MNKVVCKECDWKGTDDQLLRADHPFALGEGVTGCPNCKSVDSMRTTCDEPGCFEEDTIGTPLLVHGSPIGYRRTCHKHCPK